MRILLKSDLNLFNPTLVLKKLHSSPSPRLDLTHCNSISNKIFYKQSTQTIVFILGNFIWI